MKYVSESLLKSNSTQQFVDVLVAIDTASLMRDFLCDVMTEKEINEISGRLEAARMLDSGSTYNDVTNKTNLSSRTVARISDWMKNGRGGYNKVLKMISHHEHIPPVRAE